jgi:DNA excision repair protein ERCC-3
MIVEGKTFDQVERETAAARALMKPGSEKVPIAKAAAARAQSALDALRKQVDELEAEFQSLLKELGKYSAIDPEEARAFLKEPWCILQKGKDEWRVVIPKFVGVQVGWLERATETYNVFTVNRFSHWLGGIPPELKETLRLPDPFDSRIDGRTLRTSAKLPAGVKHHVAEQTGTGEYRIKVGHEFDIMAALIDAGSLPFAPCPVGIEDLREVNLRPPLGDLRDYQKQAWEEFKTWGAVGAYWPWGQGKTVFGGYAVARLRGPKLIVCPTKTLVEHWEQKLAQYMDLGLRSGEHQVDIVTYSAWAAVQERLKRIGRYALTIFDECHRLPANTFSRLASIPTKYRLGLSATPYREDGRASYIFALTGRPVGLDWIEFLRQGLIQKPDIDVRIVPGWEEKFKGAAEDAKESKGACLIFCDSIEQGARMAARLKAPHVHGETEKRLDTLENAKVAVVSRVGDEGLSLPNLSTTVEIDFLGASRRQESQRLGRLFHAKGKGRHVVYMTREEFEKFEGRFLALEEKGFKVNVRTR